MKNKTCLVCGTPNPTEYLDLGNQPLANSYHHGEPLERFPLKICLCHHCWHSQLSESVPPEKMFEHYLYISDTSKTLTDYFQWVTDYILAKRPKPNNVLEIASNSGLLLEMFSKRGIQAYGVDPAKNLEPLAKSRGLEVFVEYWNAKSAKKIKKKIGGVDLILAFHVLPHVQDPNDFIQSCISMLRPNGEIFIQTSQCDMFKNGEFDVIYHEHSSYFTANSIRELAHRNGLYVSSIIKTDIHGKSFLFSLTRTPCDEDQLDSLMLEEAQTGIYSPAFYREFSNKAFVVREAWTKGLERLINDGYTLIGYGAAAKGNTLLNFAYTKLSYIVDDNPMKHGYLTPGMDIRIESLDGIINTNFEKICWIPLAWNFYDEIVGRIKVVRDTKNDIFVRYFPEYREQKE